MAAWWTTYRVSSAVLPSQDYTPINGAIAALPIVFLSHKFNTRQFPEFNADLRAQPNPHLASKAFRICSGHAIFWCIYEGLAGKIRRKNDLELADYRRFNLI